MRWSHAMVLAAGLAAGVLVGHLPATRAGQATRAEPPAPPAPAPAPANAPGFVASKPPGTFQIFAFASTDPTRGGVFHGCYLADTTTGEIWLTIPDQPQKKVSGPPVR